MTLRFTPFAAALLFAACAAQPRMQPAAAREMLAEAQTLLELTQLVGVAPAKCLPLARGNQMCTWEAPSTVPGYPVLAAIADTGDVAYLVCEVPDDNRPRRAGSCRVRARPLSPPAPVVALPAMPGF